MSSDKSHEKDQPGKSFNPTNHGSDCFKTGGGVGVRKQIETFSGSNASQARPTLYSRKFDMDKKAVENTRKTVQSLTITNNKLKMRNLENILNPKHQPLSFSSATFPAQTLTRQVIQRKMPDVVVFEKTANPHNHYHF